MNVCVYCGSSRGVRPAYAEAARAMGREIARRGFGLVTGAGAEGLMGEVADAALAAGGEVQGVIPRGLFRREAVHRGLSRLHEVRSMHERKALMAELSDFFIALPGGLGTLEEILETLTWIQLGIHSKPAGILNTHGYYDPLLEMIRKAGTEGFISRGPMPAVSEDPAELLDRLTATPLAPSPRWLSAEES